MPSLILTRISVTLIFACFPAQILPSPTERAPPAQREEAIDAGKPLILTPLLESGHADKAREVSKVHNLTNLKSHSGFFTIDKTYNSNIFFWYFPAAFDPQNAPLLIWLNGGPGAATMFGLFVENGPILVDADGNVNYRSTSWSLSHSVLFIDNPVGSGFSFTKDKRGYARSEAQVTDGLFNVINQFYQLFPDETQNDLYLTGESYAGKYVPTLAVRIHENNLRLQSLNETKGQIRLKGIAVGDGFTDPFSQVQFGNTLYNLGFVDRIGRKHLEHQELDIHKSIVNGKFHEGFQIFDQMMGFIIGHKNSMVYNLTALDQYYNFMLMNEPPAFSNHVSFLDKNKATRKSLHVGSQPYIDASLLVMQILEDDFLKSCKFSVETLLNAKIYKILLYNGQLDIIVPPLSVNAFLERLKWYGAQEFATSKKTIWRVNGEVAGYKKQFDNFTHQFIRNAGHIVPYDQPEWALKMINEFILG